jgi:hypothetical protein
MVEPAIEMNVPSQSSRKLRWRRATSAERSAGAVDTAAPGLARRSVSVSLSPNRPDAQPETGMPEAGSTVAAKTAAVLVSVFTKFAARRAKP